MSRIPSTKAAVLLLLAVLLVVSFAPLPTTTAAVKTFGNTNIQQPVDWQSFWALFNSVSDWDLEYYDGVSWVSVKSDLKIIRTYPSEGLCKITLDFTASHAANYRLTFAINKIALNYTYKVDAYRYLLSYREYNVFFDWSDAKDIPGIVFTHGILDGKFWFRMRRDNVPLGAHVVIDPTFGYTDIGISNDPISNYVCGSVFTMPEHGEVTTVSAALARTYLTDGAYFYAKAMIYRHSDLALLATSNEETIFLEYNTFSWYTFTFSSAVSLSAGQEYILAVTASNSISDDVGDAAIAYIGGSTNQGHYESNTYPSVPNPLSPYHNNYQYSVYATYTPTSPPDTTPPTASSIGHTSTLAGGTCTFYAYFTDNMALSHYIFSTNNTGTWQNDTAVAFSSTPSWGNVTKTLTSTAGAKVQYLWYFNDTSNNWGTMSTQSLITTTSSSNYTYIFYGPYLDSGTVYSGSVNCTVYVGTSAESFMLDGTSGVDTETRQYEEAADYVVWNVSDTGNLTRIHYFTGEQTEEVYIYVPDPSAPSAWYTFTVTDFYGVTNGYLQILQSQGGTVLEQKPLTSMNSIPFYLSWGQTYYLRVTCDEGTLDMGSFTALNVYDIQLFIAADAFPTATPGLNATVIAYRQNATWIQINYTDWTTSTSWVHVAITHGTGTYTTTTDYTTNVTSSANTVVLNWYNADADTDYKVTVTAYRDSTENTYIFTLPAPEEDTNPWSVLDALLVDINGFPVRPKYIIGLCIVLAVAGIFSYAHAGFGCLATVLATAFLNYIGWLQIHWTLIGFAGFIAILVVISEFKKQEREI